MKYSQLGRTDIQVSRICLGTMTWGEQNSEQEAHAQLDRALDADINFIDAAEMYPVPPKAETSGRTEQYIGNWLANRNNRSKVILATKVTGRSQNFSYMRDGHPRLDRNNIEAALNGSLQRLQTDYIDLYQLHWPDRNTNYFGQLEYEHDPKDQPVPIEETLSVLNDIIKTGKVRHFGLSNETPWGAMTFARIADEKSWPRPVSIQNPYNLLNRSFEIGLSEVAHNETMGLLAYSPLGFGVLSGKYLNGAQPKDARLTLFTRFTRYNNNNARRATAAYVDIARKYDLNPAQMALAYVNTRSFLTSNIIGATSLSQLNENIESMYITLDDAVITEIEAVHRDIPNPSP